MTREPIECLYEHPVTDKFGNIYATQSPSFGELMDKINEVISVVNEIIAEGRKDEQDNA